MPKAQTVPQKGIKGEESSSYAEPWTGLQTRRSPGWGGSAGAPPYGCITLYEVKKKTTRETVASPIVHEVLRSRGQPLDATARTFFEPRFGRSFHHVRVHTDAQADRSAQALNAEAYTVGSQIVFGRRMAAVNTLRGARLMAHELTHVVQQSAPAGHVPLQAQRQARPQKQGWLPELDDILPGRVGLLTHIYRVQTLIDIFGTFLLEQHVRLIHANAAATRFTLGHGVPGVVALYDTRWGSRLDVTAARQALTKLRGRYQRKSLEQLRLAPTLFRTMALFRAISVEVGDHLGHAYPQDQHERVLHYLHKVKELDRGADAFS